LHPLDALRLRHHPALRSPLGTPERPVREDTALALLAVGEGALVVGSAAGIVAVEVWAPGDDVCRRWVRVADARGAPRFTYRVVLSEIQKIVAAPSSSEARKMTASRTSSHPSELRILTADGVSTRIVDFEATVRQLTMPSLPGLGGKRAAFKCAPVGEAAPGSQMQTAVFPAARRLLSAVVHHAPGRGIAGIEFAFEEMEPKEHLLVGTKEAEASKEFALRVGDGEILMGAEVKVRDGRVRGLRLFTSAGRSSAWFGDAEGGVECVSLLCTDEANDDRHKLVPPPMFRIVGLEAHVDDEVSSLQFIIAH
jgi:hypothetical protein